MFRRHGALIAVLSVVLTAAACGGGDGEPSEPTAAASSSAPVASADNAAANAAHAASASASLFQRDAGDEQRRLKGLVADKAVPFEQRLAQTDAFLAKYGTDPVWLTRGNDLRDEVLRRWNESVLEDAIIAAINTDLTWEGRCVRLDAYLGDGTEPWRAARFTVRAKEALETLERAWDDHRFYKAVGIRKTDATFEVQRETLDVYMTGDRPKRRHVEEFAATRLEMMTQWDAALWLAARTIASDRKLALDERLAAIDAYLNRTGDPPVNKREAAESGRIGLLEEVGGLEEWTAWRDLQARIEAKSDPLPERIRLLREYYDSRRQSKNAGVRANAAAALAAVASALSGAEVDVKELIAAAEKDVADGKIDDAVAKLSAADGLIGMADDSVAMRPLKRLGAAVARVRVTINRRARADDFPIDLAAKFPLKAYAGRFNKKGRDPANEKVIEAALAWLARHQSEDGRWDSDGWLKQAEANAAANPAFHTKLAASLEGKGWEKIDTGVTALALLALMGHGNAPNAGPYEANVSRGLDWLMAQQQDNGAVVPQGDESDHHASYGHALALSVFAEAYGLTGKPIYLVCAIDAIEFARRVQTTDKTGARLGWRYLTPDFKAKDNESDTSVTVTVMAALLDAKVAGIMLNDDMLEGGKRWLTQMTDPQYGKTGYREKGGGGAMLQDSKHPPTETMTAGAIHTLVRLGAKVKGNEALDRAATLALKPMPSWDPGGKSVNFMFWWHGTKAAHAMGGTTWQRWFKETGVALLKGQRAQADGDLWGSWDPNVDPWGVAGGRVFMTAVGALMLQQPYRLAP